MKDGLFSLARNIIPSPSSSSPESNHAEQQQQQEQQQSSSYFSNGHDRFQFSSGKDSNNNGPTVLDSFYEQSMDDNYDISEHLNMDMFANSPPLSPADGPEGSSSSSTNPPFSSTTTDGNGYNDTKIKSESPESQQAQDSPISSFPPDNNNSNSNNEFWSATEDLKYQMKVGPVPSKSRVETQIRLSLNIYPPPPETAVHLPAETISKPKLQLKAPFEPNSNTLTLDTYAVCESNPETPVDMCRGCIKRERKRAFRKKVCLPSEEAHWSDDKKKRVVVFNCKELIDFNKTAETDMDGCTVNTKQLDLPIRLACYCRHHHEKTGFRIFFLLRDVTGVIVSRGWTGPVMITDDHKAPGPSLPSSTCATPKPVLTTPVPPSQQQQPLEKAIPNNNSIDSSSDSSNYNNPRKRKPPSDDNLSPALSKAQHNPAPSGPYQHQSRNSVTSTTSSSGGGVSPPSISNSGTNTAATSPQSSSGEQNSFKPPTMESFTFRATPTSSIKKATSPDNVAEETNHDNTNPNLPVIQRIIPASGSVRGGIEVTLLGTGFTNGLVAKFGDNRSMATHVWNGTTVVAHLPPSHVPGPVIVSFEGWVMSDSQVFSYYDDTDQQLIELALQVVGLKMNGRLEDARDIAKRIIGSNTGLDTEQLQQRLSNTCNSHSSSVPPHELEYLLMCCFDLMDRFDFNGDTPTWELRNNEGQTILHLAAILGLDEVCSELVDRGAQTDARDKNGLTPLHFATLYAHDDLIHLLMDDPSELLQKAYTGQTALDLAGDKLSEGLFNKYIKPFKHSRNNSAYSLAAGPSNDDLSSSDSEDSSDEESVDADNEEALIRAASREQPQPGHLMRRGITRYFAGLRDNARTSYQDFIGRRPEAEQQQPQHQQQQPFWNHFLPERLTHREPSREEAVPPPPSYHEIFPEGSEQPTIDYTGAVIDEDANNTQSGDDKRPVDNISRHPTSSEDNPTEDTETSEEEVLEAWSKKRKQLNNDRMLFFFWLPVFIFTLVWFSMNLISYMNSVDVDGVKEQLLSMVGKVVGVRDKVEPLASTSSLNEDMSRVVEL